MFVDLIDGSGVGVRLGHWGWGVRDARLRKVQRVLVFYQITFVQILQIQIQAIIEIIDPPFWVLPVLILTRGEITSGQIIFRGQRVIQIFQIRFFHLPRLTIHVQASFHSHWVGVFRTYSWLK